MKDIYSQVLAVNDTVAVLYHPRAYEFELKRAKITEIENNKLFVELDNGERCFYKPDDEGIITRVLKLAIGGSKEDNSSVCDAIGQPIRIGDRVAFQKPIELGNTCRGFEDGGKIEKITAVFVFCSPDEGGPQKRKKITSVIKVFPE